MLIREDRIRQLLPHQGAMCLLAGVMEWDARRIVCVATSHQARDNPLAREGRLASICGVEYAGQAIALHGVLSGSQQPRQGGYLASVRELRCTRPFLHDCAGELIVEARLLLSEGKRVLYEFHVRHGDEALVSGRAAVALAQ